MNQLHFGIKAILLGRQLQSSKLSSVFVAVMHSIRGAVQLIGLCEQSHMLCRFVRCNVVLYCLANQIHHDIYHICISGLHRCRCEVFASSRACSGTHAVHMSLVFSAVAAAARDLTIDQSNTEQQCLSLSVFIYDILYGLELQEHDSLIGPRVFHSCCACASTSG